ncbi:MULTISPECIES: symporter small accessory protein [Methanothermobacter]|uniref:Uncharacterized protein n=2 Tax=Methanothermobacter TaxID=145260 RepID=O27885_METTH|nr:MULTISPECIES: symporter small accessory protein [Methanothermobacter]MBC7111046.1 hypothetical protein [Methanothermobacter sp.]AAB86323.1 unknown [Methanothermobacter thermautotrophicus str. Delta H]REE24669.1 hypothetical protein C7452_1778 [Methanothermobacter defluvii]WBF06311.1 hypothetical protein ISG35_08900 [Methanothermobacter thermautotrophicus]WBF08101.1 hypothetical protein ISG36_08940 [Methanothermobacter thermautotrophicus]
MVLGIPDPWVWGAYILCILITVFCVIYGLVNWNRGGEDEEEQIMEELRWEEEEKRMEEDELGL